MTVLDVGRSVFVFTPPRTPPPIRNTVDGPGPYRVRTLERVQNTVEHDEHACAPKLRRNVALPSRFHGARSALNRRRFRRFGSEEWADDLPRAGNTYDRNRFSQMSAACGGVLAPDRRKVDEVREVRAPEGPDHNPSADSCDIWT